MKRRTIFALALAFTLTGAAMEVTFKTMDDNKKASKVELLSAAYVSDPNG
jgi:hypothetical protein